MRDIRTQEFSSVWKLLDKSLFFRRIFKWRDGRIKGKINYIFRRKPIKVKPAYVFEHALQNFLRIKVLRSERGMKYRIWKSLFGKSLRNHDFFQRKKVRILICCKKPETKTLFFHYHFSSISFRMSRSYQISQGIIEL